MIPGIDAIRPVRLSPAAYSVGKTLAELDLRASTGATVIAIVRDGDNALLPTGREMLGPDDVLALVGTSEAIGLAQEILHDGPTAALL